MKLKETPELVVFPPTHYLFAERKGPFQKSAPEAWQYIHANYAKIEGQVTGTMALYLLVPEMVYRAGVALAAKPKTVPEGFRYEEFPGGDYLRFLLTGPYSDLPKACARVFQIVEASKIKVREGAYYGERYLNDMRVTPEAELETEILIPVNGHLRKSQ